MWASIDWNNPVILTSAVNLTKPKNSVKYLLVYFLSRVKFFKDSFLAL